MLQNHLSICNCFQLLQWMDKIMASSTKNNEEVMVCSECGGRDFQEDRTRGETICSSCGLILSSRFIDTRPEWRAFTREEKAARARTGSPMSLLLPDKGLSTVISTSMKDASGRSLKATQRAAMYRMRKWQIRSIVHSSHNRNLSIALRELDRLAANLGISRDAKETASFLYRKALIKRLVRGRTIEGMVSAVVYLACRIHKTPRQLDELAAESNANRREIGKSVRDIIRYLNLKVPIPSASNLIPRVSTELKLEAGTALKARSIIDQAKKKGITAGKAPGGIAGAAIYIASILNDDRRTQREIAGALNVTEVTIRNRYKELIRKLGISP